MKDELTNLYSREEYIIDRLKLSGKINLKQIDKFAIVIVDGNKITEINKKEGYEKGNQRLKEIADILQSTFKNSKCYRVVGDFYLSILYDEDYKNRYELVDKFKKDIENKASIGLGEFDKKTDIGFSSVFKKAKSRIK